jgi:hypothetical protein
MQLNNFIKDVITNIYDGVSLAQKTTGKNILPSGGLISEGIPYVKEGIGPNSSATMISNIEFEVSLTDGTKDGNTSGIGVLLGAISLGTKGNSETEQISLSRIKFNIPIELK